MRMKVCIQLKLTRSLPYILFVMKPGPCVTFLGLCLVKLAEMM